MSLAVSIKITDAGITEMLEANADALADLAGMHGAIAIGAEKLVKDHLTANYLSRDGARGDFWADVITSTQSSADEREAKVSLGELGIVLRYYGGEVTPGKSISSYTGELTRALAVPSDKVPVFDGRQIRPGRAGLLAFIQAVTKGGDTVGYLVEGQEKPITRGKNKGGVQIVPKEGGDLLYTLRTITRHKGDKNILPEDRLIEAAATAALLDLLHSYEGD